ncbi:MAG TPA: ABC-F family ATP-binding cassette domain-containing protein, partial [Alphaproteobacteria bacterium]|nr:ABC-F family ATP-binding cassette domain-containing protein [Alphaproteobacteria bacterium]
MLHITNLTYRVAGRMLFDQATVTVNKGHRIALVGRNGTGKTTLFRLILGEIAPDGGSISLPPNVSVGIVAQEAPSDDRSLIDCVLAAATERAALLAEAETATDPARIAEIHTRLADIGAHGAPARAAAILSGLGFDHEAQQRPVSDFSGGWRMRVALAAALFAEPELLLLDEPTNHLDLEATLWLESYLKAYPHTLLLISHDRDLLNNVPTGTIHLEHHKLTAYAGGYDTFERTRRANLERQAAMKAKQDAQRKHLQSFIDRFRAKATKARQAQSRMKMLEQMEPIAAVMEDPTVTFDFPAPESLAPPLLTLDDVTVGYGDRPILRRLNLRIDSDDRIALLGANGNGKSTLVKLLADKLAPMSGAVRKSGKMQVGYFAQHQTDELNTELTVLEQGRLAMPGLLDEKVRAHLGRFGFSQAKAETRIGSLSGGEKARLLLALMTRHAPHIMLLDEPTNHLDIDSRQALVQALNTYDGAVILISHDPNLVELCADRLWMVADGTVKPFDGDLDDYRRLLLEQRRAEARAERGEAERGDTRRDQRRNAAELRQVLAPLKKRVTQA